VGAYCSENRRPTLEGGKGRVSTRYGGERAKVDEPLRVLEELVSAGVDAELLRLMVNVSQRERQRKRRETGRTSLDESAFEVKSLQHEVKHRSTRFW